MTDKPVNIDDDKSRKAYRSCFVPLCPNTTSTQPEKLYFSVPMGTAVRKKWFECAHRKGPIGKWNYYCCEDHFVLSEDMMNYMEYKIMGKRQKLQIKKGVFPHLFECQDQKTELAPVITSTAQIKMGRKRLVTEMLQESKNQDVLYKVPYSEKDSNKNDDFERRIIEKALYGHKSSDKANQQNSKIVAEPNLNSLKNPSDYEVVEVRHYGVQVIQKLVRPHFRSVGVQCSPNLSNSASQTELLLTVDL